MKTNNEILRQEDNYEVISVTAAPFDVKDEVKETLVNLTDNLSDDELKYSIIWLDKLLRERENETQIENVGLEFLTEKEAQQEIEEGWGQPKEIEALETLDY
jgi:hypothetical protein